jgi:hypothetical protein
LFGSIYEFPEFTIIICGLVRVADRVAKGVADRGVAVRVAVRVPEVVIVTVPVRLATKLSVLDGVRLGDDETADAVGDRDTADADGDGETTDAVGDRETADAVGDDETTDAVGDDETTDAVGDDEIRIMVRDGDAVGDMVCACVADWAP